MTLKVDLLVILKGILCLYWKYKTLILWCHLLFQARQSEDPLLRRVKEKSARNGPLLCLDEHCNWCSQLPRFFHGGIFFCNIIHLSGMLVYRVLHTAPRDYTNCAEHGAPALCPWCWRVVCVLARRPFLLDLAPNIYF